MKLSLRRLSLIWSSLYGGLFWYEALLRRMYLIRSFLYGGYTWRYQPVINWTWLYIGVTSCDPDFIRIEFIILNWIIFSIFQIWTKSHIFHLSFTDSLTHSFLLEYDLDIIPEEDDSFLSGICHLFQNS